jgi:hypothetical protein
MRATTATLAALLLGCCLASQAQAQLVVTARGARACSAWNDNRVEERAGFPFKAEVHQTWLVGYLSGLAAGAGVDFLAGSGNEALFLRVDEYCRANPTAHLGLAGTAIARDLMQEKQIVYVGTRP